MEIDYQAFDSKRRFGVEFEVNRAITQQALVNAVLKAIPKSNCKIEGWHYDCGNPSWVVKTDSSCGDHGNKQLDGGGFEIVSCVGQGLDHLLNIEKVATELRAAGAVVNNHCGFHCHVEVADLETVQAATLLAYWCKIEPLMGNAVPIHRLRSRHCKFFTKHRTKFPAIVNMNDPVRFWESMRLRTLGPEAKRTTATLVNYQRTKYGQGEWSGFNRPTIELRLPEGTVNAFDAKNWVRFFIHFVENCSFKHFPNNVRNATLMETLELMGMHTEDKFTVQSAGLLETKIWFLNRLYTYSTNTLLRKEVMNYWSSMALANMPWPFPPLKLHNDFVTQWKLQKDSAKDKVTRLTRQHRRRPVHRDDDRNTWSARVAGKFEDRWYARQEKHAQPIPLISSLGTFLYPKAGGLLRYRNPPQPQPKVAAPDHAAIIEAESFQWEDNL